MKRGRKEGTRRNLGFEETIWKTADKLRSNIGSAEYKHIVTGKHTGILLRCNKSNNANIAYETGGKSTISQKLMQDFLFFSELKQQDLSI